MSSENRDPPDRHRSERQLFADAGPDLGTDAGTTADEDAANTTNAADRDDPRNDPMAPPAEACECYCLHCGRTFMSDRMWFQRVVGDPDGFPGFWMCPTPNCGGAGFTFDIFPTDPDHPANDGWHSFDDDDDDEAGGESNGDEGDWEPDDDDDLDPAAEADAEYDPDEAKYKALDEMEFEEDDLEGEEWKYGLQPGERPESPHPRFPDDESRRAWEAEQRSYDEPDRRPREVDGSQWERRREPPRRADGGEFDEDDIPF